MRNLFFAAAAALVMLASCQNNTQPATGETATGATVQVSNGMPSVAYINTDSLLMSYDRAIDMQKTFEEKYRKAEREINAKLQKLEKEVMDYQERASKGLMTRSQMAETEERLGRQQQDLMQDRDRLMNELAEEERVMNNTIFYAVSDYLKEYNADLKYSLIISTTAAGPILHADPSMDITTPVLKALNEAYVKEKADKAAAKKK